MVFVVLSGLPSDVNSDDLAIKINKHFGDNKEIGSFRINIDRSDSQKPKAVLKFKQGFDAMEAQRLLNNFKYKDSDNMIHNIKATIPSNELPYSSLFSEEDPNCTIKIKDKKQKKLKKRKHSSKDPTLSLSKEDLDKEDIRKLEKLSKKLKKKSEKAVKRSLKSDNSVSESEHKKSMYGESSAMPKKPKLEDEIPKYKRNVYDDNSKPSTSIREQLRYKHSPKKDQKSDNESTDSEHTVQKHKHVKRLLLLEPSHYLNENDIEFKEALQHIINTVAAKMERLKEDDKKLILENYTETVTNRIMSLKFTNLMSVQDIVLDYKIMYKTVDDKLLIDKMIQELQALGKGELLPEIPMEDISRAIDDALQTTDIDELMEDVKPNIKQELEYEYEDGETTEVINIVINLVPVEKRSLPTETDPEKISDVKFFVSKLKKTKPPKFFRPIRSLLNDMKLFIYNNAKTTTVPSEVILNRMVEVLQKILARMLGPVKTKLKSNEVCNLFRNSFPYEEDREFVEMIIKWIRNGEFDKGIEGLITEKVKLPKLEQVKQEIEQNNKKMEDCVSNEPRLPVPFIIKTENNDIVLPTKIEPLVNKKNETNETELSLFPKPIKMETQPEIEKPPQIFQKEKDTISDGQNNDVIIKREPVEVITIDDCDLDLKKESSDGNNITKLKLETISISCSEDEGAESDDSRSSLIIQPKAEDQDLDHYSFDDYNF